MTTLTTGSRLQCVRDSVAFVLGMKPDEVPDFVRARIDGSFNGNWQEDLFEWLHSLGIGPCFLHKGESGWGSPESAYLKIMAVLDHPVIAMSFHSHSDSGHAFVMKVGETLDEKSAYIVFDPDKPQANPGSLALNPDSEIRHYLLLQRSTKSVSWWRRWLGRKSR